jgi:23S rRNA pseudouridine1911/1915/1917 synthase
VILTPTISDRGKRLDVFLREQLPQYSRSRIQSWVRQGRVRVDGKEERPACELRGGETIELEPAELPPLQAEPEDIPLEVLYEDAEVVAVNKPAGLVVHAGAGHSKGTLVNALLHRFRKLSGVGGDLRPGIVHRLDRDTSGVLLVARTDAAHRDLAEQFSSRRVKKVYLALVRGVLKQDQGRIEKPVTRDAAHRTRMTTSAGRGRSAVTEYRVLRRFAGHTLLEVSPGTGRTHQIRVHLASIGHPVAGDRLYGAPKPQPDRGRFFLHAHRITFTTPAGGRTVTVEAPLPAELEAWLDSPYN